MNEELQRRVFDAMKKYAEHFDEDVLAPRRKFLQNCNLRQKKLFVRSGYTDCLEAVAKAVDANQKLLNNILNLTGDNDEDGCAEASDMDKRRVFEAMSQIVREWTSNGVEERQRSFGRVLKWLEEQKDVGGSVLVADSGLSRLAFDISKTGRFERVIANEPNLFMLFTANFIFNEGNKVDKFCVYPNVHDLCNWTAKSDLSASASFPDVALDSNVEDVLDRIEFDHADFLNEFRFKTENRGVFDVVCTTFFLDSCGNALAVVEGVKEVLKPEKGVWINYGTLCYNQSSDMDLTWRQLRTVIADMDFEFLVEEDAFKEEVCYIPSVGNASMAQPKHRPIFFVCRRRKV